MNTVYRGTLFHSNVDKHHKGCQQHCLEKNIFAIGYSIENISSFDEYIKATKNIKGYAFRTPLNAIQKVNRGDYIWVQKDDKYCLGRVCDDKPFYNEYNFKHKIGPARYVEKWKSFSSDEVSGAVIRSYGGIKPVLSHSDIISYEHSNWLYNGKKGVKPKISFDELIKPDDLEDILGIYLQKVRNYIFVPSSCKKSTKSIEYKLISKYNPLDRACTQCKTGNDTVKDKIFRDFIDYKIFVCTMEGTNYDNCGRDVETIPYQEMYEFAKDNKDFMPLKIQEYFEFE